MASVSAKAVSSFVVLSLLALISARFAGATEYVVGDDAGWRVGFNYDVWARDKTFLVGDALVFNYHSGYDAVVIVDGAGFRNCQTSANWGILASGSDRVTLEAAGDNWYISGVRSNCDYGEKLKIRVHPAPMSLSPSPEPQPWFPFPLPPTLSPAETPGASWPPPRPFVPVSASSPPASSPMPVPHAQTPVLHFPLPPLAGSVPPSIRGLPLPLPPTAETPDLPFPWPNFPLPQPPTAETPGLPFPWPFPFPLPPSPLPSSSAASADTRSFTPSVQSPLPKRGWYAPAPSQSAAMP